MEENNLEQTNKTENVISGHIGHILAKKQNDNNIRY